MQQLFQQMKDETVGIGLRLIAQEAELDRQFADRQITPTALTATTAAIGQTQAALRAAHLRYHLLAAEVLTPAQMQRYAQLRGYHGEATSAPHQPGRRHR
jgi:hypothetical protein